MAGRVTVLVTGGAGYIGAYCCKALFDVGYQPVAFDNLTTGHADFVKWGPLVRGDVGDSIALGAVFAQYKPVAVMHFAAASLVGRIRFRSAEILSKQRRGHAEAVAGDARRGLHEARVLQHRCGLWQRRRRADSRGCGQAAANPYGKSKLMIERIPDDCRAAYRLNSVVLRYFNASGADASGVIGEKRDVETHLIPRAMMALQGYCADFAVFGDDYETPDGTAVRDYIHVTDLASAHLSALEALKGGSPGGVYNLGTGRGPFGQRDLDGDRTRDRTLDRRTAETAARRRSCGAGCGSLCGPLCARVQAGPRGSARNHPYRLGLAPDCASRAPGLRLLAAVPVNSGSCRISSFRLGNFA